MNQLPKNDQKPVNLVTPILPFTFMPVRRLFPPESITTRSILSKKSNTTNKIRQEDRTPDVNNT